MYNVRIREHIMIAHSLPSKVFGPAQNMHGATYVVDADFQSENVDENNIVIDIGLASEVLKEVLQPLAYQNLDELPQFINVLQGRMSIVGPRPHAVAHNETYRKLIRGYMMRHKAKPGITGWAQVNGWRGETDTLEKMQKRVEFDLFYIRNWSLLMDVKIVFLTVFKGFVGSHVH